MLRYGSRRLHKSILKHNVMAGINLSSSAFEKKSGSRGLVDSSFIVIVILFCVTVIGFGGLRWYISTQDAALADLDVMLKEGASKLQGPEVDRVANFDNRLTTATQQAGVDPVDSQKLLSQLESLVIPSVKLTEYAYNAADKFVVVSGETDSFKSVAQQAVSLKSEKLFSGITVESLARTEDGRIEFSFKAKF